MCVDSDPKSDLSSGLGLQCAYGEEGGIRRDSGWTSNSACGRLVVLCSMLRSGKFLVVMPYEKVVTICHHCFARLHTLVDLELEAKEHTNMAPARRLGGFARAQHGVSWDLYA